MTSATWDAGSGRYEITLTVSDENGGSKAVTQTIAVANVAPTLTSAPKSQKKYDRPSDRTSAQARLRANSCLQMASTNTKRKIARTYIRSTPRPTPSAMTAMGRSMSSPLAALTGKAIQEVPGIDPYILAADAADQSIPKGDALFYHPSMMERMQLRDNLRRMLYHSPPNE